MNKLLMTAALLTAVGVTPASARLQLSISVGASTFTCFDGEASCDLSPLGNNLLTINTSVGGAFVQLTLAQSSFGKPEELQLSSSNILNTTGAPLTIKLLASDTSFPAPSTTIKESGSLTFNNAVGSGASTLSFWADKANVQGANPANTPGTLLFTTTGTPMTNPDSFSGTMLTPFAAFAPVSMTEGAALALIGGGSITGFNQSMETVTPAIPEASTWVMLAVGFGFMAWGAATRKRLNEHVSF